MPIAGSLGRTHPRHRACASFLTFLVVSVFACAPPYVSAGQSSGMHLRASEVAISHTSVTDRRPGDPDAGTIINRANVDEHVKYLAPSIDWAVRRGMPIEVIDPVRIPLEPKRLEATEKYSAQVKLSSNKRRLENYVAGLPFPDTDENDADAAVKLMFNYENRMSFDDLDIRNFSCDTGALDPDAAMRIEKQFLIGHYRRLYYLGRLYHEPVHTWDTPDGVRYREAISPLIEPFDLKGVGITYNRYISPDRQDDSWLYYPQSRRVRRLSTAQRSEALFGSDVDIDSFAGYAGNIAWMDWKLLGTKRLLGSMHSRHFPGEWAPGSGDFIFEDTWEMREMFVIEGRSRLPGYVYSKRVLYVDRNSLVIPFTELYNDKGELWKSWVNQWKIGREPFPGATTAVYPHEQMFLPAVTMYDMVDNHATRCSIPSRDFPKEEAWYVNFGPEEGTNSDHMGLAAVISGGR